jgi:hypothetical protein
MIELEASRARLKAAQMKLDKVRDPALSTNPELSIRLFRDGDEMLTSDVLRGRITQPE